MKYRCCHIATLLLMLHPLSSQAASEKLEEVRTTLELVAFCAAKNDTMKDVREYFESTNDAVLQREWNKALDRARKQMKDAAAKGGQQAIRVNQRYQLSCQLVGLGNDLPLGLESAMYK